MKTVSEVLDISVKFLSDKEVKSPRRLVEELLSHVLKLPRLEIYMQFDRPLQEDELGRLREYVKQAATKMPWQYIVGKVKFMGCIIEVSPDVLIPRQETEILGEMIVKEMGDGPTVVWDICCGSGCLGIGIKKRRPDCTVVLSDVSEKAVAMARRNGGDDVRQGDLFEPFVGSKADVIVCNPPYVSEAEYAGLEDEVRVWEPKMALVGEKSGFEFYERLAGEVLGYLHPGGKVYLEIGRGMGSRVREIFSGCGEVEVMKDFAGHDRFVVVRL